MKATTSTPEHFSPIQLTITLETEAEARAIAAMVRFAAFTDASEAAFGTFGWFTKPASEALEAKGIGRSTDTDLFCDHLKNTPWFKSNK